MKKTINVGLCIMNDGEVKAKYRSKRNLPCIRSLSDRQKQISRSGISSVLRRVNGGEIELPAVDGFTEHCFRVALDVDLHKKLKSCDHPYCLVLLSKIGGDPHLFVVNERDWLRNMGDVSEVTSPNAEPNTPEISDWAPMVLDHQVLKTNEEVECQDTLSNEVVERQDLQTNEILVEIHDPFSTEQMRLLENVNSIKVSLNTLICPEAALNSRYRHVILAGAAGLGKTHFVRAFLEGNNLPHARITGIVSLFSMGVRLACILSKREANKTFYIHIDDADVAFRTEEGCSVLKQMLFDDNAFIYERNIGPLIRALPTEVREAVESFMTGESLGFRVPLDNVVFLITTNIPLPSDSEVTRHLGRNGYGGILVHRNAIRSRCRYRLLKFSDELRWAWIANAFLVIGKIPDQDNFITKVMLDFLWVHRKEMQEHTIRAAELMLTIAQNNPKSYYEEWKNEFLWPLN